LIKRALAVSLTIIICFFSLLGVIITAKVFGFSPENFHDPAKAIDSATLAVATLIMAVPIVIVIIVQKFFFRDSLRLLGWRGLFVKPMIQGILLGLILKGMATAFAYVAAASPLNF